MADKYERNGRSSAEEIAAAIKSMAPSQEILDGFNRMSAMLGFIEEGGTDAIFNIWNGATATGFDIKPLVLKGPHITIYRPISQISPVRFLLSSEDDGTPRNKTGDHEFDLAILALPFQTHFSRDGSTQQFSVDLNLKKGTVSVSTDQAGFQLHMNPNSPYLEGVVSLQM
ncbi:MAG: hypothetical protein UV73_C0008G0054 [Candidatus Gottesmanbacteria bacterium GW2011_GWA2_43_14]|uniref:Uncharacterized protein n=1 Tax=Candidatus Gottesmanbacteria bacterium GW2011_GWA2_43_14 TaxID=1618443 RepID=A0A0G1DIK9_9BACT|nr:MAG: hypothetical protein UV73_C0008G0054 [Candidatus Gottesmanbacteria bacterium GW2011_GWA2_43_14]